MTHTLKGLGLLSLILLVGAGCNLTTQVDTNNTDDADTMMEDQTTNDAMVKNTDSMMEDDTTTQDDTMMEKDDSIKKDDAMMEENDSAKKDTSDTMMQEDTMRVGSYETYSPDKLARAKDGNVVLFFHASWCPTCKALDKGITTELSRMPKNLTILKTDYDTYKDLEKKYGVTYQHTLVQVDANGNMIKKWSGGTTLDSIISQLQ